VACVQLLLLVHMKLKRSSLACCQVSISTNCAGPQDVVCVGYSKLDSWAASGTQPAKQGQLPTAMPFSVTWLMAPCMLHMSVLSCSGLMLCSRLSSSAEHGAHDMTVG
jgi:hypothetical protein